MIVLDLVSVALRTFSYVGSIAVAGAVLYALSFPSAGEIVKPAIRRQIIVGFCVLLIIELARYIVFQLSIAMGDLSMAFGPDLRWMGLQTPIGQASVLRIVAALVVVAAGSRHWLFSLPAALALIASFLMEGHTASSAERLVLAVLLFFHLAAVHWWLGALYPLINLTREAEPQTLVNVVESFGVRAVWIVFVLVAAGVSLLLLMTGGHFDVDNPYQQRVMVKLILVAMLLSIAAWNKLRLTPLLSQDHVTGARRLRASIRIEIAAAFLVLAATAWLVSTSPQS